MTDKDGAGRAGRGKDSIGMATVSSGRCLVFFYGFFFFYSAMSWERHACTHTLGGGIQNRREPQHWRRKHAGQYTASRQRACTRTHYHIIVIIIIIINIPRERNRTRHGRVGSMRTRGGHQKYGARGHGDMVQMGGGTRRERETNLSYCTLVGKDPRVAVARVGSDIFQVSLYHT
jgi:hypothetical protein